MTRFRTLLLGLLALAPLSASALNLGSAAPSYDGVFYVSAYPDGDKPQPGCTTPAGWTLATKDTGFGEICSVSATEFDFSGGGGSATNGFKYVYKNVASGDFQLKARVTNEYAGATGNFAGVGITISDGTADADVVHNVFSPQNSAAIARSLAGTPGSTTNTNGSAGSRPRYLCGTYDESETESRVFESADGSTWLPVATFDYAFSTPIVGLYINSASSSESMTATMDNIALATGSSSIDCYIPNPPPPGAPVLVSSIGAQSGTEGVAFNLSCALNWTGQTPLTHPYTASGLPGGTGLSFDGTICALTGTPTASDVGSNNITVTAKNVTGNTPDTFSLTISAASTSSVFTLTTGNPSARVFNCAIAATGANGSSWTSIRKSGTASSPGPGDILEFNGVTHAPLQIRNCEGTAANPIIVRNDPTDASPATIKRTTDGESYVLNFENDNNIVLDGTGKWSGAPSGVCGTTGSLGTHLESTDTCGIILTKDVAPLAQPTWYFRGSGTTAMSDGSTPGGLIVKGVAVDALTNTLGTGIGFSINDHNVLRSAHPGEWRENIYFQNTYTVHTGAEGEGYYVGPNDGAGDIPLRSVHFIDNLSVDSGRDGINAKSVYEGTNEVIGNHIIRPGLPSLKKSQNWAINLMTDASWTISKNLMVDGANDCIKLQSVGGDGIDTATPPSVYTIENNIGQDCGGNPVKPWNGAFLVAQGAADSPSASEIILRNNTVNSAKAGLAEVASGQFSNFEGTCLAINNIFASGGTPVVTNCTNTNNRTETTANSGFLDAASDDLHIGASAPSCSQSTTNAPSDDYDLQSRPLEGAREQGADETTACP